MSSLTNFLRCGTRRESFFRPPGHTRQKQSRTGLPRVLQAALLCLLVLSLPACAGYQLGADSPSIFGTGEKTLKVKGVDYPTLDAWLPYALRSSLRDEVAARHLAVWVDDGPADYEIQIKVISYTTREWMRSEADTTLLYDSALVLEAIVYSGSNNKEVWRSGPVRYTERTEESDSLQDSKEIITQVMRQLADKMRNAF